MKKHESYAVLGVRLLGLLWITLGLWWLVAAVGETFAEFNPAYTSYYVQTQLLRPLLALGLGLGLCLFSGRMGRFIARGL